MRRMLRKDHTGCGVCARWGRGIIILALLICASPPRALGDSTIDETAFRMAYGRVREWVNALELPGLREQDTTVEVPGLRAVCIILRHRGGVVGVGIDAAGDSRMVRRAAGRALDEALHDPGIAGLPEAFRAEAGIRLTLEIEGAGTEFPLPGLDFQTMLPGITTGQDGLALRRGGQWRYLFPAHLRLTNANRMPAIYQRVIGMATELGCPPGVSWNEFREKYEITVYGFKTAHLAQHTPSSEPFVPLRGGSIVPLAAADRAGVMHLAHELARHIMTLMVKNMEGRVVRVMDDYEPSTDRYHGHGDWALTALVLKRYAEMPGADADLATVAERRYGECLEWLAKNLDSALQKREPTSAMTILALGDTVDPAFIPLRNAATEQVLHAFDEKGYLRTKKRVSSSEADHANAQAVFACALARLLVMKHEKVTPPLVRAGLDSIWNDTPEHQWVRLLPWIGWAELAYAKATGGEIIHADRLIALRSLMHASQVGHEGRKGQPDERGGFALQSTAGLKATAQSTIPAAFLATMLRDSRLTPPESRPALTARHLETCRFLMQLTVGEDDLWMYRNSIRAIGGIRNALDDTTQSLDAQALGLLTAIETIESMSGEKEPKRPSFGK